MNETIHINLLRALEVQQASRVITRFKSQKTGALLAYLAYHLNQMHPRELLIDLFWPHSTLEAGRNSLSVALSTLRHQLEPPGTPPNAVLRADRVSIGLNPAAVSTDVARFESAYKTALKSESSTERIQLLEDAANLYQGRLLLGFYDEWISAAQELLAVQFLDVINRLIGRREEMGDLSGALGYARRAVGVDPLQEQAQHQLIRLLAASGQPGAALRQYKEVECLFEEALGEEPPATLRALVRQIEKQSGFASPSAFTAASVVSMAPRPRSAFATPESSGESVTRTFLMTDIQGSTRLWERTGEIFLQALTSHHTLLRHIFTRFGGQEITEAGDSFVVAFPSAGKALDCAVAAQQALQEQVWPEAVGPLQVRMALHTGDVEYREGDYQGLTLHRASRILTTGHGGQILCSEATASLVRSGLAETLRLVDLGIWRLRDVPAPERLFQLEYPEMSSQTFPPLSAQAGLAFHLPLRFTRFFGRDSEMTRLIEMLQPGAGHRTTLVRLVTLLGLGGAGKTRLSLEVAERLLEPFQGAVWFVPLADITESHLIADTILDSLRQARLPEREPLEQVVEALSKQPALVLLDNFEHLVEGGALLVQTLLSRLPTLTILVTSRQLLGLHGEQEFPISPLTTPVGGETAEQLSLYDSVRLFVDRAQAAMPHFQITNGNAPAVAELCHRLEGIPLAIELAAARALVLTPAQMLKQLEQRFGFLVSRKQGVPERHRTLQAAIDWSYRLLSPELQRFFAQLCVFRGGWTVEAAEAVCDEPLSLDLLAQLRECSLVMTQEEGESGMRFRMLESLREYVEAHLSMAERAAVRNRHGLFFAGLAEVAEQKLMTSEQAAWFQRLERDHDNLRAALNWCLEEESEGVEVGLRLSGALWGFWGPRGYLNEGRQRTAAALSHPSAQGHSKARAHALSGAGNLAWVQGNYVPARLLHEESLAIYRELGDKKGAADSLINLGNVARDQGDYTFAHTLYEESLTIRREIGNKQEISGSLGHLGTVAERQGDFASARSFYEESLALRREIDDKQGIALSLNGLGNVVRGLGDYTTARLLFEESLTIQREIGHERGIAVLLYNLGTIARNQNEPVLARSLYQESLSILRETGDRQGCSMLLNGLGDVARDQEDPASAHSYYEEGLTMQRAMGEQLGIALSLDNLGSLAMHQGDYTAAHSLYEESLAIRRGSDHRRGIADSLEALANLALAQQRMRRATHLYGAANSLRQVLGVFLSQNELLRHDAQVATLRKNLGAEAFAAAWEAGCTQTLEWATTYALGSGEIPHE